MNYALFVKIVESTYRMAGQAEMADRFRRASIQQRSGSSNTASTAGDEDEVPGEEPGNDDPRDDEPQDDDPRGDETDGGEPGDGEPGGEPQVVTEGGELLDPGD